MIISSKSLQLKEMAIASPKSMAITEMDEKLGGFWIEASHLKPHN